MIDLNVSKVYIGNEKFGGYVLEEIALRDSRGYIIAYALLDPREENYKQERVDTIREFENDFR